MIRAYSELYTSVVMRNLAAMFDIAVNAVGCDSDEFAAMFAASEVASGIENGSPDMLAGKSGTELLSIVLNRYVEYDAVPADRTPQYWAGWVLAYTQWYSGKSFKEILSVINFSEIIEMYSPLHEAAESKTAELILSRFKKITAPLKTIRLERKLTQEQLAALSGVNIRTIRAYEQNAESIFKAQLDILLCLCRTLDCRIEDLYYGL